ATNKPATVSHLASPGGYPIATYDSFGAQSVDACLGDATPNPLTPPPCKNDPAPTSTAQGYVCAYGHEAVADIGFGTAAQWATACTNPSATAAAMAGGTGAAFYSCYQQLISYLCSPVSKAVSTGPVGVSHKLDLSATTSTDARLANAITACMAAA